MERYITYHPTTLAIVAAYETSGYSVTWYGYTTQPCNSLDDTLWAAVVASPSAYKVQLSPFDVVLA